MRKIVLIGMGAGNPEYITMQALNALRRVDALFITDKGREKEELMHLRKEICARYLPDRTFRIVVISDPPRERDPADYLQTVDSWHEQRAVIYEKLINEQLGENEVGAFLVWGDPSLYDSLIRVLGRVLIRGATAFDYEVIPGITSIQALAAQHRITLNQIGEPFQVTTGRQFAKGWPQGQRDVVVMLDGEQAFNTVSDGETEIYWGAYLGTPEQILLSGKLREVCATIEKTRAEARARKGWIMDTYLLRKPR